VFYGFFLIIIKKQIVGKDKKRKELTQDELNIAQLWLVRKNDKHRIEHLENWKNNILQ